MKQFSSYIRTRIGFKILIFFIFLIFLQVVLSYLFIRWIALTQVSESLESLSRRVVHDLKMVNGKWDTSLYNADPYTPYPHGSSGFDSPLYIMTAEGFVIERNSPINGLLDTSDIKQLIAIDAPKTITAITNERWRVMSSPVYQNGKLEGVIYVGYYNPVSSQLQETDRKLQINSDAIRSKLSVAQGEIDVSKIDIRKIHYDVSFEVINKFNKVLLNNGRIPTIIDTSYVADAMKNPHKHIILDAETHEPYMVITQILKDGDREAGVVVLGKSIKSINAFLRIFLLYSGITNLLITLPLSVLTVYLIQGEIGLFIVRSEKKSVPTSVPHKLSFDKKKSILVKDSLQIEIPYSSNQYYLCDALFSNPKKRWEHDELLERFGEEDSAENWRKVYDAMLAINKKAQYKLFIYQDKTFRLNPELLSALS